MRLRSARRANVSSVLPSSTNRNSQSSVGSAVANALSASYMGRTLSRSLYTGTTTEHIGRPSLPQRSAAESKGRTSCISFRLGFSSVHIFMLDNTVQSTDKDHPARPAFCCFLRQQRIITRLQRAEASQTIRRVYRCHEDRRIALAGQS